MFNRLIILLDRTSVSFCHYGNTEPECRLISLEHLNAGILFAMKQNLTVQFIYPDYELPAEHQALIETIDNHKIIPYSLNKLKADAVVFESFGSLLESNLSESENRIVIVRTSKADFFADSARIIPLLEKTGRINVVLTDVDTFTESDLQSYENILCKLKDAVKEVCMKSVFPKFNLLTDRILLGGMNNCNAGCENITLAPNGRFYVCPGFYLDDETDSIGDLGKGLDIKNAQLYKLQYAPLCRICDSYQCKRCVWLNRKTTREVNTPSREQCVMSHLERNASRQLLLDLQKQGLFDDKEIKEIDYLDPFDIKK
jgi:CXXX repeat peptide maturase